MNRCGSIGKGGSKIISEVEKLELYRCLMGSEQHKSKVLLLQ